MTFLEKVIEIKKEKYLDICLFKCGVFYIAVGEDADILNKVCSFKIIRFGNLYKVGFPVNCLDKYLVKLEDINISYIVYDNFNIVKWSSYEQ